MLVVDSLPFGNDVDQTLLPCSPGSIMDTDIAAKTVLEVHADHANKPEDQELGQQGEDEDQELGQQGEDEVITRRMQFRAKNMKKAARQKKKEEKAAQKLEKEKAKEEKKKAREQKKQEKAQKKDEKKTKKNTKKGQDEQKSKEKKPRGKKRPREEDVMDNVQSEDQGQEHVVKEKETGVEHVDCGRDVGHGVEHGDGKDVGHGVEHGDSGKDVGCSENESQASPTRKHVKNAKLMKLRRMKSKAKMSLSLATHVSKKRKFNRKHAELQQSVASGGSTVEPKNTKKQMSRKGLVAKGKHPVDQPAKKGKQSKSKASKPDPCPKIVALVQGILSQCKDSDCTHPTWSAPKYDQKKFQVSVYWTRHAVGVKVATSFLPGKSSKGKSRKGGKGKGQAKFTQVAYFGSPTPCIYSNLAVQALSKQQTLDPKGAEMKQFHLLLKTSHEHAVSLLNPVGEI
eukprot:s1279_g4.t1